jgi:hypothetical protein
MRASQIESWALQVADCVSRSQPMMEPARFGLMAERKAERKKLSLTIDNTNTELIVDGPGLVKLEALWSSESVAVRADAYLHVDIALDVVGAPQTLPLTFALRFRSEMPDRLTWELSTRRDPT